MEKLQYIHAKEKNSENECKVQTHIIIHLNVLCRNINKWETKEIQDGEHL